MTFGSIEPTDTFSFNLAAPTQSLERFQREAERAKAIEDALQVVEQDAVSGPAGQLKALISALEWGALSPERAVPKIAGWKEHLLGHQRDEESKSPVQHPEFTKSREEKKAALKAWLEAIHLLEASLYVTGHTELLKMARYAIDEGEHLLEISIRRLSDCRP